MIRRLWCWNLLVVLLFLSAAQSAPAPEDTVSSSVSFPGGIADPAKNVAYVANTKGGIDAIDLDKGDLLWEIKGPALPVALSGKKLLAQLPVIDKSNAVRIVVLDTTEKGKKLSESDPITFPDWVSVRGGYGRDFTSSGRVHDGDLLLNWDASTWYSGKLGEPSKASELTSCIAEKGIARINLQSGKVDMLAADKMPPAVKLPKELEEDVTWQKYLTSGEAPRIPLIAGKVVAGFEFNNLGAGKERLSLHRWDLSSGKQYESVSLLEGKSLLPQVTTDTRHLLVRKSLPKEQLSEDDYAWWVFDMETGKQVAKLPYDDGPLTNPIVIGSRLYFLLRTRSNSTSPRTGEIIRAVRAFDLKSGKVAWEHSLMPETIMWKLP